MMIRVFLIWILLSTAASAQVVVFASASLKEPVDRIAVEFPDVVVSYAASGTLARHVAQGAPADVILLAHIDWMNYLRDGDFVRAETVVDFASNTLVMVTAAKGDEIPLTEAAISDFLGQGRIATGLTSAVPAGIYAKEALIHLGLWDAFADRLAEVDNVRAALALVDRGQARLGIVYATDARVSDRAWIIATFPDGSHAPIRYSGALTARANDDAVAFLDALVGAHGQSVFAEAGFLPPVTH
ncbi:molybdate ABC transporter substrate-binding protein [Loktanella sp. D2R18]|uniref:molybdate ABC transporter substrate-binding protein n=1 Tax=Rhodobacterales TaxID=204455 RepID=UPI000DE96BB9|nr:MULTISPECIES: molybdate ABC transporter substrate-binding protein [Rhodobacterales]MDO6590141.1 molybdate ABC transporter substrate-binding protein [Yoonia sp. 1_MG-2023]RBW45745.1 molybdate ABC transporter substrate-binding protein [Loktanella sp. D2R18]